MIQHYIFLDAEAQKVTELISVKVNDRKLYIV